MEVKPLSEVMVIGKGTNEHRPFSVSRHRGLYFFIPVEEFDRLREANDAYKALYRGEGAKPLEKIKIVGRGGAEGYRPFMLKEHPGLYLCILADHLRQLEEVNLAYATLLEAEKQKEAPKPITAPTQPLEEPFVEIGTAVIAEEPTAVEPMPKIEELAPEVEAEAVPKPKGEVEEIKPPEEEGRYVYCIIPSPKGRQSFRNLGIENNSEVYTIDYGGFTAVASNAPFKEYVLTEENVMAHNQVIQRAMEEHPVVPMAFGMVFKNEEVLKGVLGKMRGDLKKALKEVEGKVELGVKVILPKGAEIDEEAFASEIKQLREIASQSKLGRRFSKRLLLNAFYLVAKENVHAFSEAIEKLQEKFTQLKIQYSGPWPPFNFATIKVGKE